MFYGKALCRYRKTIPNNNVCLYLYTRFRPYSDIYGRFVTIRPKQQAKRRIFFQIAPIRPFSVQMMDSQNEFDD